MPISETTKVFIKSEIESLKDLKRQKKTKLDTLKAEHDALKSEIDKIDSQIQSFQNDLNL